MINRQSPILIHIPHSSTFIPTGSAGDLLVDDIGSELLKMTDLRCDDLFDCSRDMIVFPYSRLLCDVERFRDDAREIMSAKGMGAVYTKCSDGSQLRSISAEKREQILRKYYDRHHEQLNAAAAHKLREPGGAFNGALRSEACQISDGKGGYPDIWMSSDLRFDPTPIGSRYKEQDLPFALVELIDRWREEAATEKSAFRAEWYEKNAKLKFIWWGDFYIISGAALGISKEHFGSFSPKMERDLKAAGCPYTLYTGTLD